MGRAVVSGARYFALQSVTTVSARTCCPSIPTFLRSSYRLFFSARPSFSFASSRRAFGTSKRTVAMASNDLPISVEGLSLQSTSETSKFANCFPSLNPVDIYREHIAEKLSEGTGIEAEKIYSRLMWTSTLDKGDLVLPVCSYRRILVHLARKANMHRSHPSESKRTRRNSARSSPRSSPSPTSSSLPALPACTCSSSSGRSR